MYYLMVCRNAVTKSEAVYEREYNHRKIRMQEKWMNRFFQLEAGKVSPYVDIALQRGIHLISQVKILVSI